MSQLVGNPLCAVIGAAVRAEESLRVSREEKAGKYC